MKSSGISRAEALAAAQAELDKWQLSNREDTLILLEKHTKEMPYAWVVYWSSKLWYETRKLEYAVAGAGPFIVSKQTGHVTCYSSAYGTESALELYEEEQQLYGLRVTADLTDMRHKLLLKKLLPLSNQELLRVVREPDTWVASGSRGRLQKLQRHLLSSGLSTELLARF